VSRAWAAPAELEYRPFPDRTGRNAAQRWVELPLFLALLRVPHGARVLEVGCGRGVALPVVQARRRPSHLVGLDVDESLLDVAAARVAGLGVELVHGDVRAMPFADASFDVVIDFGTLFHVGAPGAALREVARVLAPRGRFCLETPLSQALSHPLRSRGRRVPWEAAPELRPERSALLWCSRRLPDRA
jgi:ubiquinone/menaquinone biosynthesis C-methylase UbiE